MMKQVTKHHVVITLSVDNHSLTKLNMVNCDLHSHFCGMGKSTTIKLTQSEVKALIGNLLSCLVLMD